MAPGRRPGAKLQTTWRDDPAGALDVPPLGRCRFEVSPPRHFLFPALVLLLAEAPRHGYLLVDALAELGLGRVDRPSVYRALAELEHDGLVRSHAEAPIAGSTRRVYAVTRQGERALEAWMSIVAAERNCLELVLERYWYCKARRWSALDQIGGEDEAVTGSVPTASGLTAPRPGAGDDSGPAGRLSRFQVVTASSRLVIEIRSSLGPVAFSTDGLAGWLEVCLRDGLVTREATPVAHLEVRVNDLRSGNSMFDRELLRRADARRFPLVVAELRALEHMGEGNCYRVWGDVAFHGAVSRLEGVITATVTHPPAGPRPARARARSIIVTGEQMMDVRDFELSVPAMPMFKIYPDVRVRLHLEADEVEGTPSL